MLFETFLEGFSELDSYPEARIRFFLDRATDAVPCGRFGKETDFGRCLHAAHHLVVLGTGMTEDARAATPKGAVASKSVGSVSVSYDTGTGAETDAGFWNSTGYGRLYWQLMKKYRRLPTVVVGRAQWP